MECGEKYDESDWAKGLSEKIGVEHHYKVIQSEEFWGNIKKVQYHMDQPLSLIHIYRVFCGGIRGGKNP